MYAMNMKGGAFIYQKTSAKDVFVPEDFNEEQLMIKEMILDFVYQEVTPNLEKLDSMTDKSLMPSVLKKSGELGMMGVNISEELGGMDLDMVTTLIFGETTAHGHAFATAIGAHTSIGSLPIVYYGTDAQKEQYLPGLASGELMASYCLTEPDAGSDANSGKTKAILNEEGTHYIVNGQKMWITNGGFADIFIVFAKIDDDKNLSAFIVEKEFGGITLGEEERKMGIKGSSTIQVFFNDCEVPKENLLGARQGGFKIALNILNSGRIKIGASAVGGSKVAIGKSVQYANERKQFGKSISEFAAIQHKLGDMAIKAFATESATYRIGNLVDKKYQELKAAGASQNEAKVNAIREYAIECSIAKVYGSDVLCYVTDEAIQIHGGMGYAMETGVERGYRDARITKIYEGTNEVNRLLIVGELMKRAFQTKEIAVLLAMKKAPVKAASSLLSFGTPSLNKRIENLKQLFLLLTGSAGNKLKKDLIDQQEIVMNLSDILTEIFVLESTFLRAEKAKATKHAKADLFAKIAEVQAFDASEKVHTAAKEVINAYTTGLENKMMKKFLKNLVPDNTLNTKEYRREIAKSLIADNGYSLS
ncbi:MAG: alkylation response protein AidB-like acyl-CoA dehydrogenase [Flavobacteriales bacterium]|jgi:alkylation response protein AidB-like acyl-CoA dehydrogenase|tara:strand:- start:134 stop:1906 length:1773 start_codon:yes stop_codon:yes gene_type:complete